jgi:hypothetical protein
MRSAIDQQVAAGEAKAAEASDLAATQEGLAPGSPARAKYEALIRESTVHEIPAFARVAAAGDCYSDQEIAEASDRLDVLATNFSKYVDR